MKIPSYRLLGQASLITAAIAVVTGCATPGADDFGKREQEFLTQVKPLLETYCLECHNRHSAADAGGLNLENARLAMSTGRYAPVVVPGKPDASLLYKVLRLGHEEVLGMPPTPEKVSDQQLAAVRRWIKHGAVWPEGAAGQLEINMR